MRDEEQEGFLAPCLPPALIGEAEIDVAEQGCTDEPHGAHSLHRVQHPDELTYGKEQHADQLDGEENDGCIEFFQGAPGRRRFVSA